jgi:hypothetical protein
MARVPSSSEFGSPNGPFDTVQHPRRLESSKSDPLVTCPIPTNKANLYI